MADLSDVSAYLAGVVSSAVYPNGTGAASVAPTLTGFSAPMDVRVFEGWPLPEQLDLDLAGQVLTGTPPLPTARTNGPCVDISVYPVPGATSTPYQIFDKTYVVSQPTFGLTVGAVTTAVTISGTPVTGEFVTLICDQQFIYSAAGVSAAAILNGLLTQAQVNYPSASLSGSTLTVPVSFNIAVRQGGVGTLGKVTHRQCQSFMVTVWAPDPNSRSVLAKAVDGALKQTIIATLPDGTDAKIVFKRTDQFDEGQNVTSYRRDLYYEVEYATLQTFPGTIITAVSTVIAGYEYPTPQAGSLTTTTVSGGSDTLTGTSGSSSSSSLDFSDPANSQYAPLV